jgi:curli biogenesis system outer membrane secretion channel CsgG
MKSTIGPFSTSLALLASANLFAQTLPPMPPLPPLPQQQQPIPQFPQPAPQVPQQPAIPGQPMPFPGQHPGLPGQTMPGQPMPNQFPQMPGMPGMGIPAAQIPHQGNLPNAPASATSQRNRERPTVTIREFRSSVAEVTPRGATDMFMTALVKTRKFRVIERARMAEGIATEKALNQQGMTTGQSGQAQYKGAEYMFEATVSEASAEDSKTSFGLGIFGAGAGKTYTSGSIAIDVRVTDVESGVVVDAIDVRKEIKGEESKVSGITSALGNALTRGRLGQVLQAGGATDEYVSARKDSVDKALREAIEQAVNEIAKRFGT